MGLGHSNFVSWIAEPPNIPPNQTNKIGVSLYTENHINLL
jgi:hypothetical protein